MVWYYGVTKWKFLKDQKMSFKEIKDEYKNTEGDPNVKAALRQRRMQMLQKGMMDAVPESDFVVRNPIHVACALKYDQAEMECPVLTAKGSEILAQKIIKIAEENNIQGIIIAGDMFDTARITNSTKAENATNIYNGQAGLNLNLLETSLISS